MAAGSDPSGSAEFRRVLMFRGLSFSFLILSLVPLVRFISPDFSGSVWSGRSSAGQDQVQFVHSPSDLSGPFSGPCGSGSTGLYKSLI